MEVPTETAARLLGISESQLLRYGNEGKITYRPHGPRGRRRYDLEQLRIDAQSLNLSFSEELVGQITEKSH
jgi:DNA-binding transcriptional MerR regulator